MIKTFGIKKLKKKGGRVGKRRNDKRIRDNTYGAIKFGEFRQYMQNKQNKLKNQQKEIGEQASQELPQIFHGLSIYINGYTNPTSSELRKMILQHGGDYQHYLKKLSVTHIVATNLTNAKKQEFRSYKVVKPEWIVDSINARQLLPWQQYRVISTLSKQKELVFQEETTGEALNTTLLANDWAKQVSTVNPDFIHRYYETSRLHHLSAWKAELKDVVLRLKEKYPNKMTGKKRKRDSRSVIMHIDFDCFFASVGIKDRPHLKDRPVAVSHSKVATETSSSDIASCNYIARSYGVKNGMMIGEAKKLCPELQVIPYEFEKYRHISEQFYDILYQYADQMQPVSVDEAFIEVGSHITELQAGQEEALAREIRDKITTVTGCEASIGIGPNLLLARMATKKAKPANQFYCQSEKEIESLLSDQSVKELPGVGYAIAEKLSRMNVTTIYQLRNCSLAELQSKLGQKMGQTLYNYSRGIDERELVLNQPRQSVSAEVNWGVRFESEENEREVAQRLQNIDRKAKSITVKVLKRLETASEASKNLGHGEVNSYYKSYTCSDYMNCPEYIFKHAYSMIKSFRFSYADIRGIGIQLTKLNNPSPDQTPLTFGKSSSTSKDKSPIPIDDSLASRESSCTSDDRTSIFNEKLVTSDDRPFMVRQVTSRDKPSIFKNTALANKNTKQNPINPNISSSRGEGKPEMVIDSQIYAELPLDIQQELENEYQLVIQGKTEDETAFFTQIPELPPWSQLDPTSLIALPPKMREQILHEYGNRTSPKVISHDQVEILPHHRDISPAHQALLSEYKALTAKQATNSEEREDLPEGWDRHVWKALPSNMRHELMAEYGQANNTKTKPKEAIPVTDIPKLDQPSWHGLTKILEIRSYLLEWISANVMPSMREIDEFITFLSKLVRCSDLEKVRLIVLYMDFLVQHKEEWKKTVEKIKAQVATTAIDVYGSIIKYY
ncbi:hypothetical protein BDB01DRAFT_234843 [Pilobolus umbonatus]|nr:hypothetical protein BDB01DRAFT_234843 [Pilobolus umbonatus]